ncbi:MAG: YlxR family protein [Oscillospiraceae bacterium]|nr:YlxR family protein [Oscillospiraceae bacterium]
MIISFPPPEAGEKEGISTILRHNLKRSESHILKFKHIPIRKCIACGERKSKDTFLRIVRTSKKDDKNKIIIIDSEANKDGRGYYLCKDVKCVETAKKKKKLERIFTRKVSGEIYEQIQKAVQNTE